jgi:hypothetical protein
MFVYHAGDQDAAGAPKEIPMAPTRRDIVKLGAALGFGSVMPTGAERIAAMQVLNRPLSDDPRHEPGTFAVGADNLIGNVTDHWWKNIAPDEEAQHRQAERALEYLVPILNDGTYHKEVWRAYDALLCAATAWACASYEAGLRQGARYEHLRLASVKDGLTD